MRRGVAAAAIIAVFLLGSPRAEAEPQWYQGDVTRIYLFSAGFVIKLSGGVLSDCLHGYVYFKDADLGEKQVDRAYSMILAAHQSGRSIGVVIDKAINGPGGVCNSNGSVDVDQ